MKTGKFNENQKVFFGADEGAFTTMTSMEVNKGTYNVKAVMRDLFVRKVGEKTAKTYNKINTPTFSGTNRIDAFKDQKFDFVFRYSKPDKNEMSMYFPASNEIIRPRLKGGNIWFLYFKTGSSTPWLGIMTPQEWVETDDSNSEEDFLNLKKKCNLL